MAGWRRRPSQRHTKGGRAMMRRNSENPFIDCGFLQAYVTFRAFTSQP